MIFANDRFLSLAFCTFVATAAIAAPKKYDVKKQDGSVSKYAFLPVKYDPTHEAVVKERLAKSGVSRTTPDAFQIPRANLPDVRDQGQRGSCAYFATLGLVEKYYLESPAEDRKLNLSEECLLGLRDWIFDQKQNYSGDDQPDVRPDPNGDYPQLIIKTVAENGVAVEGKYSNGVDCRYRDTGYKAISRDKYHEVFSSGSPMYAKDLNFDLDTHPTIERIKELISQNIPVEVGILVYNEHFYTDDWRYDFNCTDSTLAGAHAVVLTGYRVSGNHVYFTFRNSWGQSWGSRGYGTIDDKLLAKSWSYDPSLDFIISVKR